MSFFLSTPKKPKLSFLTCNFNASPTRADKDKRKQDRLNAIRSFPQPKFNVPLPALSFSFGGKSKKNSEESPSCSDKHRNEDHELQQVDVGETSVKVTDRGNVEGTETPRQSGKGGYRARAGAEAKENRTVVRSY